MIVKNMTDSEIVKELKSIEDTLNSRRKGYWKKFGKELKSKAYKHCDVLGEGKYVINGNKVLVCFQKLALTDKCVIWQQTTLLSRKITVRSFHSGISMGDSLFIISLITPLIECGREWD